MKEKEIEREWTKMEERLKKAIKETEEKMGDRLRKGWWDEECVEKKRIVKKKLRKWRKMG